MSVRPSAFVGLLAYLIASACILPAQAAESFTTVGEALQANNLTILSAAVQVRSSTPSVSGRHCKQVAECTCCGQQHAPTSPNRDK
jgi:hypothetical protein